jgi:DNA-binding NarL/FixJ family response regulator
MVGNGIWSRRVEEALKKNMGVSVQRDSQPPVNGYPKDFHVLILESLADPGFKLIKALREKWNEQELPVIVVDDNDNKEVDAMRAGASAFLNRSMHYDTRLLEKLVYGLAYEG